MERECHWSSPRERGSRLTTLYWHGALDSRSRQPVFLLCFGATSTVGMPVARHPPYSPGRAVFPHPVLRLYSLPRCKAGPSSNHSPTWNLRNTRTHYLDAVEDVGKLLPRVTTLLASPPVAPCERTVHRPMEEAVERAGVPAHAIVVVVASQSRSQTLEEFPPRQVP